VLSIAKKKLVEREIRRSIKKWVIDSEIDQERRLIGSMSTKKIGCVPKGSASCRLKTEDEEATWL